MRRKEELLKSQSECVTARVMETEESRMILKNLTSKLTAAEKKVLALVSSAKTNKEIAFALGISPATVKRHLENVLRKLHLKNRVEAAIYGLTVDGCSARGIGNCPLAIWRKERDADARKWAM
jgi:DNA-binding CsgD family transcriptional regulator